MLSAGAYGTDGRNGPPGGADALPGGWSGQGRSRLAVVDLRDHFVCQANDTFCRGLHEVDVAIAPVRHIRERVVVALDPCCGAHDVCDAFCFYFGDVALGTRFASVVADDVPELVDQCLDGLGWFELRSDRDSLVEPACDAVRR